jgi:hypothetical protein
VFEERKEIMAAVSVTLRRGLTKVKKPKYMGMVEEVEPLRLPASTTNKKGASAAALTATAGIGAAAMADGMPKKGAPTAEAKGRRGGRTGYAAGPAKPAAQTPKDKDGNTTATATKAKVLGGREVKNGKVFVSAKELEDFKKKYGSDKTLTDLLNKERNLTRREDKSKLKPLKTMAEDRKALDEAAAKKKAREEEVKKMVKAAGLAKGGMAKKKK